MGIRATLQTAAVLVLGASAAVMMLYRFDSFPGLHGDEAWTGLRALEHEERGLFTLHGMRYYAGSIYPYLLSLIFKVQGASVASLRLPGLVMNLAGLGILLALVSWHSPRSAGLFVALSCTSLLLLLQARIAWEVMAWNLFGLACLVAVAYVSLARERSSALAAYLFFAASILGALNHFVFVSLNLAFALASAVLWWSGRAGAHASRFLQLNVLGVAVVLMACALQWRLGDEAFERHSTVVVTALVALPLIATALWVALAGPLERLTQAAHAWLSSSIEGASARWPRVRSIAAAALVPFLLMHGVGLTAALGNDLLYRRLFGYVPPLAVRLAGLVFVVVLLAAVAAACVRAIQAFWLDATDVHGSFWAICLPVYAACFPLFTSRESARHYLLLTVALFYTGAVLVPRYLPRLRTRLLAVTLAFAATTQAVAWWSLSSPPRPPLDFRVGWRRETSKHLLSIAPLYERLKSEGICRYEGEYFIREPLEFLRRSERWDCANPSPATIEYCSTCEESFFFSIQR